MIVLYNAFLSCPLPKLNQRSPFTDVMSYKCYHSIWVSHMETTAGKKKKKSICGLIENTPFIIVL